MGGGGRVLKPLCLLHTLMPVTYWLCPASYIICPVDTLRSQETCLIALKLVDPLQRLVAAKAATVRRAQLRLVLPMFRLAKNIAASCHA